MRLRTVIADKLADLKFAQLLYDVWADEKRNEQRRKRSKRRAKGKVAEYPERMEKLVELDVEQPIEQGASPVPGVFSSILQGGAWAAFAPYCVMEIARILQRLTHNPQREHFSLSTFTMFPSRSL